MTNQPVESETSVMAAHSKTSERTEFCNALLGKVQVVLDSSPETALKVNRAVKATGEVDGYYEVLTHYDPETDLFNNKIPASRVERVAFYEAVDKVIDAAKEVFK